ncbi:hypothetical protein MMC07_009142, partial [Pseudocyphellaria aurata]|nr:hypothetical protein [Pseudocyphellaria aurata]
MQSDRSPVSTQYDAEVVLRGFLDTARCEAAQSILTSSVRTDRAAIADRGRRGVLSQQPSVTGSIFTVLQLSGGVFKYLKAVNDASEDRKRCAEEISNSHSLLHRLKNHLDGSPNDAWHDEVQKIVVKNGPLDQFKEALELLRKKTTVDGSKLLKKIRHAVAWKFNKEEVKDILNRIERLKSLVQAVLQLDQFKLSQAIKDDTGLIQTHIHSIEYGVDDIRQNQDQARQSQNDAQHKERMKWISATNFPAKQSDVIAGRQEGTGQWFLDAPDFKKWLDGPNETLFCPGIPGAGKTMIAAIAVDHLLNMASVATGVAGVACVYCDYKAQDQHAAHLLAAILKQLLQARPDLAEPVIRLHKQHANRDTKPSLEEIFVALQSVVVKYSSVYVVVDALDECSNQDATRGRFLAKLRDLQSKTDLRIMATSRFNLDIEHEFSAALKLEIRASNPDVKRYVAGQFHRLPRCIQRDNELHEMVQEKIMQAVEGMFLLARLYVDSLSDKITTRLVKDALESLSRGPQALNKAYDEAMERIKGQLPGIKTLATNVLSWIVHAQRPLTTKELCHALAVEPDDKLLDQDNVVDIEEVVDACAGLVTVDEKSGIIRLVHHTAQGYFQQVQEEWNLRAQLKIASTCLTYLSFDCFQSGRCSTHTLVYSRLCQNPFLDYAANYWGLHIQTVQEELCELACSFLQSDNLVSYAAQIVSEGSRWTSSTSSVSTDRKNDHKRTGLHLTAQFGLHFLSELLLSRLGMEALTSVDWRRSDDQNPILLAAVYGHDAVVKLLIDKRAEVNGQCESLSNALLVASLNGHE